MKVTRIFSSRDIKEFPDAFLSGLGDQLSLVIIYGGADSAAVDPSVVQKLRALARAAEYELPLLLAGHLENSRALIVPRFETPVPGGRPPGAVTPAEFVAEIERAITGVLADPETARRKPPRIAVSDHHEALRLIALLRTSMQDELLNDVAITWTGCEAPLLVTSAAIESELIGTPAESLAAAAT